MTAAWETPGSPNLDSFGLNMSLAKKLLEKGERDSYCLPAGVCEVLGYGWCEIAELDCYDKAR
jgi:hypothetical protein